MSNYFRTDGWVKSSLGPAIPGAQIFVCTQPANIASVPPSPLAMIFSDPNGLVPITQPIITDGFGHYDFYTTPGVYTVVVALGGIVQQVYPDQSVGGFGSSGSLILQANGVSVADQLLLNLVGAGSVSVADAGAGTVVITGATTSRVAAICYVIDGGGSLPSTGLKGQLNIPVACTITGWVITADVSGSAVVDILRSTYAAFPTTVSIAGTDKPTLVTAQSNEDLTLTGWGSVAIHAGDQIQFNLISAISVSRLNITLNVTIP
jgi:hypothetical protein